MTIYTHNGVYYDLPTDDPDLAKQKIKDHLSGGETAAQTVGRGSASLADTLLGLPGAAVGEAAYAGYRFKQGAESLANAAMGKGFLPTPTEPAEKFREQFQFQAPGNKFTVGRLTGTEKTQGYENAPLRSAGQAVGQFIEEGAVKPIAEVTGIPEADVGNMMGTMSMAVAPAVPKVGRAIVNTARALPDVAEGAINTLGRQGTKPGQRATYAGQYESARQPAGTTYNTPENLQAWREGVIDTAELNNRALQYTPEQAAALKRTGGMVPYGKENVARATGEALAEPYTRLSGYLPDLASAAIGYGLLGPAGAVAAPALNLIRKGVGLYNAGQTAGSMRQLGDLGFQPLYAQEAKALQYGRPHPSVIPTAAGPINPATPQTMAAAQVNPAAATTPAAQAAVNTTQAKAAQTTPQVATPELVGPVRPVGQIAAPTPELVGPVRNAEQIVTQTQKNKQAANLANQQRIEKMTWEALQQRIANGGQMMPNEQTMVNSIIAKYGDNPFGTGTLTARTIKTETPAAKTPVIETPEAAAVRTADDVMREFKDQQRGIVRGDTTATRQNFMNNVEEVKQSLIAAREENKAKFGDRAKVMNPNAGQGSKLPNPKDSIDEKAVVRHMIKQTGVNGVRQSNKQIIVNREGYNDLARQMGVDLDWTTAPDVKGMGVADARKKMNTWTFNSIDQQFPELGLKARQESMSSQQRRAEKEAINNPPPPLSAEEQARLDAIPTRTMDSNNKLKSLLNKGESPKLSTPKITTPVETEAARPEGVPEPAPLTKAQLLEMIKNRSKGNSPPGVMEVMTKDGPESMYSYKGILDDVEQASHSVMQQNIKNGGKGFSVSYKNGKDFIHEHKHNGYHKVEIEHPNGTMSTITKMEGSPHTKYQDTTYMTAKVDITGIPRNQKTLTEKPANWMSVEDEVKKYFGNE